jgi:branched-chain amino acid transport system substrate-binding protein
VVAQKLVDSKVSAVIGHVNSGVSIPANSIYAQAGIAQISTASTNPDYTKKAKKTPKGNTSAFRVVATDDKQGPALVQYLKDVGAKNILVLDDSSQFGKGVADQVEKQAKADGINVVGREAATDKTVDFKAILTKFKGINPDFIFWGGFGDTAAPLIQQAKELGLTAKLIAPDGTCTETFIKLAHEAAEGSICSQAGVPAQKLAQGAEFSKLYEAKYPGQHVEIYAPYAYDAVYAIVNAIKKANSTDSEAIAAALPQISFNGYIGKVEFTSDGELKNAAVSILEVRKGKFEVIKTL